MNMVPVLCSLQRAQLYAAALSCHKVNAKYMVVIIIDSQQSQIRMEGSWDPETTYKLVHGKGTCVSLRQQTTPPP